MLLYNGTRGAPEHPVSDEIMTPRPTNSAEEPEIFDSAHSDTEDRFIAIGQLDRGIAVVVYTERDDDLIRIIGARFATKREQELYRQHMDQHR